MIYIIIYICGLIAFWCYYETEKGETTSNAFLSGLIWPILLMMKVAEWVES